MSTEPDLQPDVDEVLQEEAPDTLTMVPVCVQEVKAPVRTQALPRKGASTMTRKLTTTPAPVLRPDHWRGRAVLIADAAFLVSFSLAAAQADSSMAMWPAAVPLELSATVEVWAKTATGTANLSVIAERWAEG